MKKAIIFDLDGTLTVLTLPLETMRQDTKKYFITLGVPADVFEPADGISSSTMKAKEYMLEYLISEDEWDSIQAKLDEILTCHENISAEDASLLDDTLHVLSKIKQMGFTTAILTNNGRHSVDIILEQLPLAQYFEIIVTRNETPNPKPFPDGLIQLVGQLGIAKDEAVYVGDASIDGVAAQRAGVEFWGVTTGETDKSTLRMSGAALVFSSLSELLTHLSAEEDVKP
jgi:phosphoglycolate phosphatase